MKKFLVTGANGDIGEAVGRILIENFPNAEILVLIALDTYQALLSLERLLM